MPSGNRARLTLRLLGACACLALTTGMEARALTGSPQASEAKLIAFHIPPQPLASALTEFGRQSRTELLFSPRLAASKRSDGISGSFTPEDALSLLLAGSGLTFRVADGDVILIEALPVQSGSAEQAIEPVQTAQAASVATDAEPAVTSTSTGDGLEEVVVTAQRRKQKLQDVPVSVNSFNSDFIEQTGAKSVADLQKFTPGLTVRSDGGVTQAKFAIRGVSTDDFGIGTDSAVGIFIDGVYSSRSGAALVFFNDVERVEVLKGPQGTLFGRNTAAGAISIITKKPDFDDAYARTMFRIGDYQALRTEMTGNLPLTDELALRVNFVGNKRDGYLTNALTGEHLERENNYGSRVALRWAPAPGTDIELAWDHDHTSTDGPPAIGIGQLSLSRSPFEPFENDVIDGAERRRLDGVTLTVEHDISDSMTLTSLSGYKNFKTNNREDEDGTSNIDLYFDTDNREKNESFYQELRLSGTVGPVTYTGGASYFWEDGRQTSATLAFTDSVDTTLFNVAGVPPIFHLLADAGLPTLGLTWQEDMHNRAKNNSWAVFGDVTWAVTDKLNVTVGARYTEDKKKFTWFNEPHYAPGLAAVVLPGAVYNEFFGTDFPDDALIDLDTFYTGLLGGDLIFNVGPLEGIPFTRDETFTNFSPRGVLEYHWTDDIMTYVSVAKGYKAGGYNSVEVNSFFKPEKVTNVEGGIKSEWFDKKLRVNLSVYWYEYNNRQQLSLESISGSGIPQYVTITGDSEAWGADFDGQWLVTDGLVLSFSAGWIDATWTSRVERGVSLDGEPTGEPRFRGVLGVDYSLALSDGGEVRLHADYSHTSPGRENSATELADAELAPMVDFDLFSYRSSRDLVNARVTWALADDSVEVSAWVDNLFDKQYVETINDITASTLFTPYTRLSPPRFVGVDLTLQF